MRAAVDFTIYAGPRNKAGKPIFYYRLRDESGKRHSGKSTGKTSRSAARQHVLRLIESGELAPDSALTFARFAETWWLAGKCRYLKTAANNGTPIGRHHAAVQRSYLTTHILPFFASMRLSAIRVHHIEQWRLRLHEELAPATAANVYSCLRTMLNEAERLELIHHNPIRRVKPARQITAKRRVLAAEETRRLFRAENWQDPVAFAANLFAAFTGARLGECLALQASDLHDGYVTIRHSLCRLEGLKGTKTGVVREVPIPAILERVLTRLTAVNTAGFVSSRDGGSKPVYDRSVTRALKQALIPIGVSADEIRSRGLSFHSWRHFYNTVLLQTGLPVSLTQQLLGHTTEASTRRYSAATHAGSTGLRTHIDSAFKEYHA